MPQPVFAHWPSQDSLGGRIVVDRLSLAGLRLTESPQIARCLDNTDHVYNPQSLSAVGLPVSVTVGLLNVGSVLSSLSSSICSLDGPPIRRCQRL
jgi:hypothetical protein